MAIASRYIGGIPYDPGRSVGRYPNRASVGTTPGIVEVPGVAPPRGGGLDGAGIVAPQVDPSLINAALAANRGGGGGDNMLAMLMAGLPLLGYLPDAYDWLDRQLAREAPQSAPYEYDLGSVENTFDPGGSFVGPGGASIPTAALGGFGTNWNNVFEPGSWSIDDAGTQALLDAPMPPGDQFAGAAGDAALAAAGGAGAGGWGAAIDAAGGFTNAVNAGTLPLDFGLTGSLGSIPGLGDVATGGADILGGMAGHVDGRTAVPG